MMNACDEIKINNIFIKNIIKSSYQLNDLENIQTFFQNHDTLRFVVRENGLYPALTTGKKVSISGYTYIWLRDTIMITNYQREIGNYSLVSKTLATLSAYFYKHRLRFINIIEDLVDKNDPMQRPHVRFNGDTLEEVKQKWAHAQNDALGYVLWMVFKLANENKYTLTFQDCEVYSLFPLYFQSIEYWQDEDSGHWEEVRKLQSSSIGVVVAALEEMRKFISSSASASFSYQGRSITPDLLEELIEKGKKKLYSLLPYESPPIRKADAATLFLIYPLEIISEQQTEKVLQIVLTNLKGLYGLKRYLGDSYWCANYKKLLKEEERTIDFSEDIKMRDLMFIPDTEAQWCIFDPIISVSYGLKYLKYRKQDDLNHQIYFFNRSMGQITSENFILGGGKCPEAYFIQDSKEGEYLPNDHVPLAWTQANLGIAFEYLKRSLQKKM